MLVLLIGGMFGLSMLNSGEGIQEKMEKEELGFLVDGGKKENINKEDVIPLLFEGADKSDLEEIQEPQYIEKYNTGKVADIYQIGRSKEIKKKIEKKIRKNGYAIEKPLWIWNAYGTNELSMNVSFETADPVKIRYTISVKDNNIPDFSRTLKNDGEKGVVLSHNYQINGFVPGVKNFLIIKIYSEKNKEITRKTFSIQVPKLKSGEMQKIKVNEGKSDRLPVNGLFCTMGDKYVRWYDNSGFIRGETPTNEVNGQKIEMVNDTVVFAYKKNGIAIISKEGQVLKTIDTGIYQLGHDFIYNGYGKILAIASDKNRNTVSDIIISIDIEKEDAKVCLDMRKVLPDVYKEAKKNTKDGKLDWVSLTSLNQQGANGLLLTCHELSSLIKVNNIFSKIPDIAYIVGDKNIWKQKGNLTYKNYLYEKNGQAEADANVEKEQVDSVLNNIEKKEVFASPFGIYNILTEKSTTLEESQYYVYFINNNYGNWGTRKNFSWKIFSEVGTKGRPAKNSFYYKYLVDEKAGTYDLIEQKKIAYSNQESNIEIKGENKIIYQAGLKKYYEEDIDGRKIREFILDNKVYRVIKKDMKGFWYQ